MDKPAIHQATRCTLVPSQRPRMRQDILAFASPSIGGFHVLGQLSTSALHLCVTKCWNRSLTSKIHKTFPQERESGGADGVLCAQKCTVALLACSCRCVCVTGATRVFMLSSGLVQRLQVCYQGESYRQKTDASVVTLVCYHVSLPPCK